MALTLVRHTTPDVAPGICYGVTDLKVVQSFEAEAFETFKLLDRPGCIIASPLSRCAVLTRYLAERFDRSYNFDDDLKEMDFGRWENLKWSDIPRAELDMWAADFLHARPHGGESVAMLYERTTKALSRYKGDNALIVTHSGVIKCALATGQSPAAFNSQIAYGAAVCMTRS